MVGVHFLWFICVGFYQDFQKEGKIGKKDQAKQTYAKLGQIQDWQQNQIQRQEKTLEKNKAEVLRWVHSRQYFNSLRLHHPGELPFLGLVRSLILSIPYIYLSCLYGFVTISRFRGRVPVLVLSLDMLIIFNSLLNY
jgi:hypothetical protein